MGPFSWLWSSGAAAGLALRAWLSAQTPDSCPGLGIGGAARRERCSVPCGAALPETGETAWGKRELSGDARRASSPHACRDDRARSPLDHFLSSFLLPSPAAPPAAARALPPGAQRAESLRRAAKRLATSLQWAPHQPGRHDSLSLTPAISQRGGVVNAKPTCRLRFGVHGVSRTNRQAGTRRAGRWRLRCECGQAGRRFADRGVRVRKREFGERSLSRRSETRGDRPVRAKSPEGSLDLTNLPPYIRELSGGRAGTRKP